MTNNGKKKGGTYLYAKNKNGNLFFERGKYRVHLCGLSDKDLGFDKFIFQCSAELGFRDFREQFRQVMAYAAEKNVPILSLYEKDGDFN